MAAIEILKDDQTTENYTGKLAYEAGHIIVKDGETELVNYTVDKVVHATAI